MAGASMPMHFAAWAADAAASAITPITQPATARCSGLLLAAAAMAISAIDCCCRSDLPRRLGPQRRGRQPLLEVDSRRGWRDA